MLFLRSSSTVLLRRSSSNTTLLCRRTFVSRTLPLLSDLPYHLVVGLPALSPTMENGSLAEWYLKEGDGFMAGDAVAKIETDKAAMDFEAQDDGYIAKILVPDGSQDIAVGTPIMITVEEQGDVAAFANYELPDTPPPPPPKEEEKPVAAAAPPKEEKATPPPPPPVAAAVTPAPAATPPPTPSVAPVGAVAFSTAWGLSVVKTSPLAKTLNTSQSKYIELYGTTGQAPILKASA